MAKAKYRLGEIMSMTSLPDDYDELLSIYRTAAKAADQRMVRLERLAEQENFKVATQWSYARAQRDAASWSESGEATRFNIKPPRSVASLQHKIQDIRTFLGSASSTKTGILETYAKRSAKLKERYDLDVSWQKMGSFFESQDWKVISEYDSKQAATVIAKIRRYVKSEDLKKAIEKNEDVNIKLPVGEKDRGAVEELVRGYVREYGNRIYDLLYAGK